MAALHHLRTRLAAALDPEISTVEKLLLMTLILAMAIYAIDASLGANVGQRQRENLAQEAMARQGGLLAIQGQLPPRQ